MRTELCMRGLQSKVEVKDIRTECRTVLYAAVKACRCQQEEKHGLFVGDAP